jgi:hypothetical protein
MTGDYKADYNACMERGKDDVLNKLSEAGDYITKISQGNAREIELIRDHIMNIRKKRDAASCKAFAHGTVIFGNATASATGFSTNVKAERPAGVHDQQTQRQLAQ